MPLGYSNIHRPQAVSRSVSFGVVEPYIETSSMSLGKSPSSGNLVQTAATFPSRNRRLICRSHSTDEAYLCSRLSADILSDTTNTEGSSTGRSATPFAAMSALPSSLRAFSSANQECRDGTTTDEMLATSGDDVEQSAQENDEDAIFRSSAFGSRMAIISRLEPTIGEASDEEDQDDDEEYYNFNFRRSEQSEGDDSHSRQGSSPSSCVSRGPTPSTMAPSAIATAKPEVPTTTITTRVGPVPSLSLPPKDRAST